MEIHVKLYFKISEILLDLYVFVVVLVFVLVAEVVVMVVVVGAGMEMAEVVDVEVEVQGGRGSRGRDVGNADEWDLERHVSSFIPRCRLLFPLPETHKNSERRRREEKQRQHYQSQLMSWHGNRELSSSRRIY